MDMIDSRGREGVATVDTVDRRVRYLRERAVRLSSITSVSNGRLRRR